MKPLFEVNVYLDQFCKIKGGRAEVTSISFHGDVQSELFQGTILPGAVDTQIKEKGKDKILSARYILEGTDAKGQNCRIFVENRAVEDDRGVISKTIPTILTDSPSLGWLEEAELEGVLTHRENGISIAIYEKAL